MNKKQRYRLVARPTKEKLNNAVEQLKDDGWEIVKQEKSPTYNSSDGTTWPCVAMRKPK